MTLREVAQRHGQSVGLPQFVGTPQIRSPTRMEAFLQEAGGDGFYAVLAGSTAPARSRSSRRTGRARVAAPLAWCARSICGPHHALHLLREEDWPCTEPEHPRDRHARAERCRGNRAGSRRLQPRADRHRRSQAAGGAGQGCARQRPSAASAAASIARPRATFPRSGLPAAIDARRRKSAVQPAAGSRRAGGAARRGLQVGRALHDQLPGTGVLQEVRLAGVRRDPVRSAGDQPHLPRPRNCDEAAVSRDWSSAWSRQCWRRRSWRRPNWR